MYIKIKRPDGSAKTYDSANLAYQDQQRGLLNLDKRSLKGLLKDMLEYYLTEGSGCLKYCIPVCGKPKFIVQNAVQ